MRFHQQVFKHYLVYTVIKISFLVVGFNIKTLEYKNFMLNLWDVGGQKTIRAYWRNYFEQTDGVIWVVDSVDRWRMEECRTQLRELLVQEVPGF